MKTFGLILITLFSLNITSFSQDLKEKHICWSRNPYEKFIVFENRKVYSFSDNKYEYLYKLKKTSKFDTYALEEELDNLEFELHENNEAFVEDPDNKKARIKETELKKKIEQKKKEIKENKILIVKKAFIDIEKFKMKPLDKVKDKEEYGEYIEYFDGSTFYKLKRNELKENSNELMKFDLFFDLLMIFV